MEVECAAMRKYLIALFILLAALVPCIATAGEQPRVSEREAREHALHAQQPPTPPLAKAAKIGGTVVLDVSIGLDGRVTAVKVVSGHPMLVQAAVDAVRKWQFKPFMQDGNPTAVVGAVNIVFASAISVQEEKARQQFFPLMDSCRALIAARDLKAAEKKCSEAVSVSDELPADVLLERVDARTQLAHTLFLQVRYAESLPIYQLALDMNERNSGDQDADVAGAYANLARAYWRNGDPTRAYALYGTSIEIFKAAVKHLPDFKDRYLSSLKRTLLERAQVARKLGKEAEATGFDTEASRL
jgi:TonB family protein